MAGSVVQSSVLQIVPHYLQELHEIFSVVNFIAGHVKRYEVPANLLSNAENVGSASLGNVDWCPLKKITHHIKALADDATQQGLGLEHRCQSLRPK